MTSSLTVASVAVAWICCASFRSTLFSEAFVSKHRRFVTFRSNGVRVMPSSPSRVATTTTTLSNKNDEDDDDVVEAPSMIVFDLDNTLWEPELYQVQRKKEFRGPLNKDRVPVAGKDVRLFPAARTILETIRSDRAAADAATKYAVASRTKSGTWALDLLNQFGLDESRVFDHVEIFPGDKKAHFRNLRTASGVPFSEMLFFDDARDGTYGNCVPVSGLGVLCVHCPNGLRDDGVYANALRTYGNWRRDGAPPNTIVEWDGTVTTTTTTTASPPPLDGKRRSGVVKMVNREKRFGFIVLDRDGGDARKKDLFFHFNNLPENTEIVEPGDQVEFEIALDPKKKGATMAVSLTTNGSDNDDDDNVVTLPTFSMNQPFAALLANGHKTLETRNGTMFVPHPPGTVFLLHVGRRTYPDGGRHVEVMRSGGPAPPLDDDRIEELKSLPPGYRRGQVVAVVEIGDTFETTLEERCDPDFQRRVGAYGADSGRLATEIRRAEWLAGGRGVPATGRAGVFRTKVNRSVLPDGWS